MEINKNTNQETYRLIDENGEIIQELKGNFTISTEERKEIIKQQLKQKKDMEELKQYNNMLGGFIMAIYKTSQEINKHEEILTQSDLARLVYLSTYLNYEGFLVYDNGKPITKKNLKQLLLISGNKSNDLYKKLLELEIIKEIDKNIYINRYYFYKGDTKKIKEILQDSTYIRIYIQTFRDLYKNCESRQHKMLGLIYRIIPYLNYEWNIICHNPMETNGSKIIPITLGELTKILNYSNQTVLKKQMLKFKICEENIFGFFTNSEHTRDYKITINPKLVYQGSDMKKVKYLQTMFEI